MPPIESVADLAAAVKALHQRHRVELARLVDRHRHELHQLLTSESTSTLSDRPPSSSSADSSEPASVLPIAVPVAQPVLAALPPVFALDGTELLPGVRVRLLTTASFGAAGDHAIVSKICRDRNHICVRLCASGKITTRLASNLVRAPAL